MRNSPYLTRVSELHPDPRCQDGACFSLFSSSLTLRRITPAARPGRRVRVACPLLMAIHSSIIRFRSLRRKNHQVQGYARRATREMVHVSYVALRAYLSLATLQVTRITAYRLSHNLRHRCRIEDTRAAPLHCCVRNRESCRGGSRCAHTACLYLALRSCFWPNTRGPGESSIRNSLVTNHEWTRPKHHNGQTGKGSCQGDPGPAATCSHSHNNGRVSEGDPGGRRSHGWCDPR
jgi:hypothetical protein